MSGLSAGRTVFGVLLVLLGAAWLLAVADVIDVDPKVALAVVLIAVGLGVVVVPRGQALLVLLAVPLLAVGLFAVTVDASFEGGVGERLEDPRTLAEVEDAYELGIGRLVVDLTAVDFGSGSTSVEASLGIGELVVTVPAGVALRVRGEGSVGNLEVLGEQRSGLGLELDVDREEPGDAGTLELDVRVGVGNGQVQRR